MTEIKSNNLRPEMHHVTVRVIIIIKNYNDNYYAPICKEGCKLTNFSSQCCHVKVQKKRTTRRPER